MPSICLLACPLVEGKGYVFQEVSILVFYLLWKVLVLVSLKEVNLQRVRLHTTTVSQSNAGYREKAKETKARSRELKVRGIARVFVDL